jgi:hypothetical protein
MFFSNSLSREHREFFEVIVPGGTLVPPSRHILNLADLYALKIHKSRSFVIRNHFSVPAEFTFKWGSLDFGGCELHLSLSQDSLVLCDSVCVMAQSNIRVYFILLPRFSCNSEREEKTFELSINCSLVKNCCRYITLKATIRSSSFSLSRHFFSFLADSLSGDIIIASPKEALLSVYNNTSSPIRSIFYGCIVLKS